MLFSKNQSGQILIEVLIAIVVAALVVSLSAQLVYVSLQGNKISGEKNVASDLLEEAFAGVKSASLENWLDLYTLNHDGSHYYPQQLGNKWIMASGTENFIINTMTLSRFFVVQHVCRDNTSRAITGITDSNGSSASCTGVSGSSHDPSTQKITATIGWAGNNISESEYMTRWRNKICLQTAWLSISGATSSCPATTYGSITNITPGASLELCSGGC